MPEGTPPTGETPAVTFDKWIEAQPDDVKTLLDGHIKGLKTALDSERESRKGVEKQLKDLATKAELGSEAQKQLTALADQVQASERRQSFYDEAHSQGVSNLKLAYLAATDAGLIDDKGRVNWEQLKKAFPQLFSGVAGGPPRGNAGDGTSTPPGGKVTMNSIIRRAAGQRE
jgi:ABC-type nitrate/sulfonate/bicarbonate transport system substrate-binding protein